VCGVDNDTTYSEGTGLDLTGTTFSIEPSYRVKNTPDCPSGKFATGFDDAGAITCAVPAAAPPDVWFRQSTGDAPEGHENEITSVFLLSGNYLVNVVGTASDDVGGDDEVVVTCNLYVGDDRVESVSASADTSSLTVTDTLAVATLATMHVAKLTATTKLRITCRSSTGSDHVRISMSILEVGTVG
jgi:hypothetical protein